MNRRRFLQIGASTGAIGLLAGCLGGASTDDPTDTDSPTDDPSEQPDQTPSPSPTDSPANATDDQGGESGDDPITTPDENERTTGSDGDHQTATPDDGTKTPESGSGEQAWSAGGEMNGVAFEFTSRAPKCGQGTDDANVAFQPDEGRIVVEGVRRGSDLCTRAQLGAVSYDPDAERLAVSVDAVDREECQDGSVGAGQCIVDIPYEARFSFEGDIPSEVAVSHGDRFGVSAAYGSASATPPEE